MQPRRRYLLAFLFYNNSMDAAGAAQIAALYVLANTDVPLTITEASSPLMRLQPGPDAGRRAGAG